MHSESHPKSDGVQSFEAPGEKNHLSVTKRVSLVIRPLAAPLGFEEWKGAHPVGDSMAGGLGQGVERGGGKGVWASFYQDKCVGIVLSIRSQHILVGLSIALTPWI